MGEGEERAEGEVRKGVVEEEEEKEEGEGKEEEEERKRKRKKMKREWNRECKGEKKRKR